MYLYLYIYILPPGLLSMILVLSFIFLHAGQILWILLVGTHDLLKQMFV